MVPSATMLTTAWRARTSSSRYPWTRPPLMCCGRRPDGPAAESSAKERRASWTKEGEGVVARETTAAGRNFLLATSSARGCGWRSRVSLATASELGGVRRARRSKPGKVPPLSPGPHASSLGIVRVVIGLRGVSRLCVKGVRCFCQRVPGPHQPAVRTFVACRWRIVCCSVCPHAHDGGQVSGGTEGRSKPGCQCVK